MDQHLAPVVAERYAIEREIGRGGMATVYLAWDRRQMRRVALKLLRPDVASAVNTERFVREIRVAGAFQHPHILPLHDSGMDGDLPFYVMPYVEGESLRARLAREKLLPVGEVLEIAEEVASALSYAHANGVLHRDVSPANILLASGTAKPMVFVADFGIARAIDQAEGERLTSTGIIVGTPDHMSPEQAAGERDLDARTDIYSLASVLFEMLAGVPPFTGATQQAVMARKVTGRAPLIREYRESVPEHVERALARALAPVRADRFPSVDEFAAALRAPATRPTGSVVAARPRRRRGAILFGAGVAVVAAGGFLGARTWSAPERLLHRGERALAAGRLTDAANAFRGAMERASSSTLAAARLGLAESTLLDGDSATEWRSAAIAAARDSMLPRADRSRALALAALARGRYAEACAGFRRLASTEPTAALELLQCLEGDHAVVRDAASPSGWRFRASYDEGVRVSRLVLDALPAGNALRAVAYRACIFFLRPENRSARSGTSDDSKAAFAAFGMLEHDQQLGDTVAYVPYPLASFMTGAASDSAARNERAIDHDRALLRDVARAWAREFPGSEEAHVQYGRALELSGEIAPSRSGGASALDEIRSALRLSPRAAERVHLARAEARLLVKRGDFAGAREVADSVLARPDSELASAAEDAAALAALTGRAAATARLLQSAPDTATFYLPDGGSYLPRPELANTVASLFAYAALGGPVDSLTAQIGAFERQLASYSSEEARDSVRAALLERPLSLAVPVLGAAVVNRVRGSTIPLVRVEQALARKDFSHVRAALDAIALQRTARLAASTTLDATYLEAWLRAAIGDTARAERQLDLTLDALPTLPAGAMASVAEAAALGRAMALRADIAAARHEDAVAARWRNAVRDLWAHADRDVMPMR